MSSFEKNRKLKELSQSVSFEELSRLGRAIQNETHSFGVHENIFDTSKFVAFHVGQILTTEPTTLLDSSSEKLRAITNTVRKFAEEILSTEVELNSTEKEKVQKIYDMLKEIPDLPFEDSNYADQIQSLNSSLEIFLEQLEEIK